MPWVWLFIPKSVVAFRKNVPAAWNSIDHNQIRTNSESGRETSAWASYQIHMIAGCACAGNAGNVSPRRRFQREQLVSDPGMPHGTCVTHVPWCMSGSRTRGVGENVPGIPGACAHAILAIWQEARTHFEAISPMHSPADARKGCIRSLSLTENSARIRTIKNDIVLAGTSACAHWLQVYITISIINAPLSTRIVFVETGHWYTHVHIFIFTINGRWLFIVRFSGSVGFHNTIMFITSCCWYCYSKASAWS